MCAYMNLQCFNAFANKQTRTVYLVLEYCNMGTLKSYVEKKKRLSEKEGKVLTLLFRWAAAAALTITRISNKLDGSLHVEFVA